MRRSRWERKVDGIAVGALSYIAFGVSWTWLIVAATWAAISTAAALYDANSNHN